MSNLCPKCGAELFEGGRFCMVCGFPIEPAPVQEAPQPMPTPHTVPTPQAQPMPQTQAPPQPMPMQPEQEQKPRNMTQEFIERRKRERGQY